mgnify:FL=1
MMDKNWKQKLQDKMAHYEEPAPDGLWESIERNVPAVVPTHTDRGHTVSLWFGRLAGAAAAIAIALLIGKLWWNQTTDVAPSPTTSGSSFQADIPSEQPAVSILDEKTPEVPRQRAARSMDVLAVAEEVVTADDVTYAEDIPAEAESDIPSEETPAETEAATQATDEAKATEAPARATASNALRSNTSLWPALASKKAKHGRLTASLYASGATTDREIQRSYNLPYGNGYLSYADYGSYGNAQADIQYVASPAGGISNEFTSPDADYPGINPYNNNGIAENSAMVRSTSNRDFIESSYADYKNELKHHQPLRGGISLRYKLSDRLAIESGVTYTRMASEATDGGPDNYYHTTQTLHYIGIPVNVLYTFWKPKALELYVLGGGMGEKNVKGKQETTYTVGEQEIVHQDHSFTEKRLQWSVNGGVGIQYNMNQAFGVYAEPSVSYYFNNHSWVSNYYKDKPLEMHLKVGLRYSFDR